MALLCVLTLLLTSFPGCSKTDTARAPGPIRVVVTVAPLAGLIKPLLPEGASVTVLMSPGRSEHGYEFTPADLAKVAQADVMVCVGGGLEPAIVAFLESHPSSWRRDLCCIGGTSIRTIIHRHNSLPMDPHVWLDPGLCMRLIDAIEPEVREALETTGDSSGAAAVHARGQKLRMDIQLLDGEYTSRLGSLKGHSIVTHHNAWRLLADRYGLNVAAVMRDIDEGEMTAEAVAATVDAIRKQGAKAVFVEPQFDRTAAERIAAAAGVKVFELDPLGDGDWFKMMRGNLESLVKALGE